jgi:hypothetical protein
VKSKEKFYTISTRLFTDLDKVGKQLETWEQEGTLDPNTQIFEVSGVYPWETQARVVVSKGKATLKRC